MSYDLDLADPTFPEDLAYSDEAVVEIAQWLRRRGNVVVIPPLFLRDKSENRRLGSDQGDLFVQTRLEVRRRKNMLFTKPEEFPYASVIIEECKRIEEMKFPAYAYIIANSPMTHAFMFLGDTMRLWTRGQRYDAEKSRVRDFYFCDKIHAHFIDLKAPQCLPKR